MRALLAVFWSFFGVRRRDDWQDDAATLKPTQLIVAGLVGAAAFVLALILLVRWIVS